MAIVSVNLTDTINSWRLKFNQIASNQGDLNSLTTTETSTLVGAINEINRGGVSPPLANLQDVRITNVADNQFVRYNVSTGMWENKFLDTGDVTQFEASLSILESQITFSRTLATESYVDTAIANLIDGAPSTLDTLNEIAAAIADDPTFYQDNATQTWVQSQNYLQSSDLVGYATETYVDDGLDSLQGWVVGQNYLQSSDLSGYATETYVDTGLDSLQGWVVGQGYIDDYTVTQTDVTTHQAALSITKSQISDLNLSDYVLSANLAGVIEAYGYATETYVDNGLDSLQGWVIGQNYLQSADLAAYATQTWVQNQNYLQSSDLNGYATETYVDNGLDSLQGWVIGQNYLQSADLPPEVNDLSSSVTWATVPDAYISEVSVTQHQDAINTGTDAHLNQSNPTAGYVLSWSGTDYAWVAQTQASGGINAVENDNDPHLGGDLDLNSNNITGSGNINITGSITVSDNITAYSTSDITLKENIRRIPHSYKILSQINGVIFDWTEEEIQSRGGIDDYFVRKSDLGVVAQQVMQVAPELVVKRPTTGKLAVKYDGLIPIIIEAIKEVANKRVRLQEFDALEKKVEKLTALVEKLQNNA